MSSYVHGYEEREARRLADQAQTLVELLHHDSTFPDGATILEAGCGVGAQTVTIASLNPSARITSVDVSTASLELAAERCAEAAIARPSTAKWRCRREQVAMRTSGGDSTRSSSTPASTRSGSAPDTSTSTGADLR